MVPILMDIATELTSSHLLLRAPHAGDGAIVHPTVMDSIEQLKSWMIWATDQYKIQDAEEWCRRSAASWIKRELFQFLIFLREGSQPDAAHEDGLFLGNIGVFNIDWKIRKCEIGYWLRTSHTGKGYMTEATAAVHAFAREALAMRRTEIRTEPRNLKSRAVAERLGFQLEGILRSDSLSPTGEVRDTCVYSSISPGASATASME